eukprot:5553388-Pyramimonas_sp.AAC.1
MNAAPRSTRPAALYEHLRTAYSRRQRGFMYMCVLLSPPREEGGRGRAARRGPEAGLRRSGSGP